MKKTIATMLLALTMVFASGCRSSTSYGECVGIQEEDQMKPNLQYKLSVRNTVLGVIFFETIFAPAIWLFADFKCPVGPKQ